MLFADKIDAPIGCSLMGISAIPETCSKFLGMQGMHGRYSSSLASRKADLVIGIGVRFSDRATSEGEKIESDAKIIQLDADLAEINKNVTTDVGIACDIADALKRISEKCKEMKRPKWQEENKKLKDEERKNRENRLKNEGNSLIPENIFDIIN